jgi:GNAT superfamily N-acetyltransferase
VVIRRCRDSEREAILAVIGSAAEAYRGVIPPDRWHEPYFPGSEFDEAVAAGVAFWGCEIEGELAGVMGIQPVGDVELIRHAYVVPARQGSGIGGALLEHLMRRSTGQVLVGTWATAEWAIRFYQHHGFALVGPERTADLLRRYWSIPERQIETSVVLARPPFDLG